MPLPILIPIVIGLAGVFGVGKSVKAGIDVHKAKNINQEATEIIQRAKNKQYRHRSSAKKGLQSLASIKMEILSGSMTDFVKNFERIKHVEFEQSIGLDELVRINEFIGDIHSIKELSNFASSLLTGTIAGAGVGSLIAFGTYGATTAFAVAGTGTGIATLSRIAATNATLAWIGGGTLASGGLGIAGGTAILGVMVVGPAIAVMGLITDAKASKMLNDAKSNLAIAQKVKKEIDILCLKLDEIRDRSKQLSKLLSKADTYFIDAIVTMKNVMDKHGTDWRKYNKKSKEMIFRCVKLAQLQKALLDTAILAKSGNISAKYKKSITYVDQELSSYEDSNGTEEKKGKTA